MDALLEDNVQKIKVKIKIQRSLSTYAYINL
jgi:hypothetical protein